MGRFYKTSKPEYLDFVYKQPNNLLLKAVEKAEQGIDKNLATVADLYGRLHSEALKPDTERRNEIIDSYKSEIDALSQAIFQDPLSYRGFTPEIKTLSDDIANNLQRGELAAMASNVKAKQDYIEKLDAQVKAKSIDQPQANWLLNKYEDDFDRRKGTMYAGPQKYQSYRTGYFAPDIDIYDKIDKRGAGWKADAEEKAGWNFAYDENNDRYIVTNKKSGEVVSEAELQESFKNYVLRDDEINDYYNTRIREGYFTPEKMAGDLASAVNYGVSKYGYTKTTDEKGMKDYGLSSTYASRKLKNTEAVTTRNFDEANVEVDTYSDQNAVNATNNNISGLEAQTKDLGHESMTRKFAENLGLEYNSATDQYLKDGQPYTFTDKDNEKITAQIKSFNSALDFANRTGDYSEVLKLSEGLNDVVKQNIKELANNNTPEIATKRYNNSTINNAIKQSPDFALYLSRNAFNEEAAINEYIKDKKLTTAVSPVALTNDLGNLADRTGKPVASQVVANNFISKGKDLVKNRSLFTQNGVLVDYTIDKDGNVVKSPQSANLSSLLTSGKIRMSDIIKKKVVQRQVEIGYDAFGNTIFETRNVSEPISIGDGKFLEIATDEDTPLEYTYGKIPGTRDNEFKYAHKVYINELDENGNQTGKTIEALVVQNESDFNFSLTDGTDYNQIIKNSDVAYNTALGQTVSEGIQVANKFKANGLSSQSKIVTGQQEGKSPEIDDYVIYQQGPTKISWRVRGGNIEYYENGRLINTAGRSDSDIQKVLMQKIKENLNNTGIK